MNMESIVRDAGGVPRADVLVEGPSNPPARQNKWVHVRHPPSLPRRNVAVRRLGGRRVREPRRDGRADAGVVHDVAEAAHGAGQRARAPKRAITIHVPFILFGAATSAQSRSVLTFWRGDFGLHGFHPSRPRRTAVQSAKRPAFDQACSQATRAAIAERCDQNRQPSEKWHRAARRPPGARAKF